MTKKEKLLLGVLACLNFTHIVDFMIMMPLQEYLVPVFNISPQQFSFLVSAYAFSAGISSILVSMIIDRFDRKIVLLIAYIGFLTGTIACSFAVSYNLLLVARIMSGLFGGLISAQVLSIIGDIFPYERRGRAMGILMTAFAVASVAGVPLGLYFAGKLGWSFPFLAVGVIGIFITPFIIFIMPSMRAHIASKGERGGIFDVYKSIYANPNQQMGLLMMFTLILSHFLIIPFIAPYLEINVGFSKEQIALMYFVGGTVSFFGAPIVGKLADKYGKHIILRLFLILSSIPVIFITNMPRLPYYYVLVVTGLFFLFAGGRMIPAQALITSVVSSKRRGGFMNINSSLQQLATGMAALIAGTIVTKNEYGELQDYEQVGYLAVGMSVVCMIISWKVKSEENPINQG